MKWMSYMRNATGEEILRSWLAKRPDIVERCKQHGITVDVAEGGLPHQPSDGQFLPHATDCHSYPYLTQHTPPCVPPQPHPSATVFTSTMSQRPPCSAQERYQTQPTVNQRQNPSILLTLSQSPHVLLHSPVSPMAAHHSPPSLVQSQHPSPSLLQSQHPTSLLVQSQHPTPPLVQSQHPTPPLVQSQHPAPPMLQLHHEALQSSSGMSPPLHHLFYHYKHQI